MSPPNRELTPQATEQRRQLLITGDEGDNLNEEITEQGNKVRDLKSKKADKAEIDGAVKVLLELKAKYKAATGKDWKPGSHQPKKAPSPPKDAGQGKNSFFVLFSADCLQYIAVSFQFQLLSIDLSAVYLPNLINKSAVCLLSAIFFQLCDFEY